jgi:glycosyltransferase involved in cell wall biosynthesis
MVMPFMTPFHGTSAPFESRRDICFLGGYRHTPNIDAVLWFVRDILPLLLAELPDLRFIVAGAHPGPEIQALARSNVIVTGMVEDLGPMFDATRVFVCPLRAGAGVKGKLATAMSYGVPVVTTPVGAEGMDLKDGYDALIAEDAESFAAACLRAYRDPVVWAGLSLAAQEKVPRDFSREAGLRALRTAIDRGLEVRLAR